jgi:hypothetical protein
LTIRKASRDPDHLGSLELFVELDEPGDADLAMNDARRVDAVVSRFKNGLAASLDTPSRLYGWRTQEMFAAVVLAIGGAKLLSFEDGGPAYYFDDVHGAVKAPDVRLVTHSGDHLLVEVKNVGPRDTLKRQRIRRLDLEAAQRYAEWTEARLMIAHYWGGANLWTLVDPRGVTTSDKGWSLSLEEALPANELSMLGDVWIGTTPPLVLSLLADPQHPGTVQGPPGEQHAELVIGNVELSCGGRVLENDLEQKIAWSLMAFGGWQLEEVAGVNPDGTVTKLDYVFAPEEPVGEGQGFEIVGPLSSLYSALYNLSTLDEAGLVTTLRRRPEPGALADLIPQDYWDTPDRALPLWRFTVLSNESAARSVEQSRGQPAD